MTIQSPTPELLACEEAFHQFVVEHLGPVALRVGKMSIYEAAKKAWQAAWEARTPKPQPVSQWQLHAALKRLVDLKIHKETHGKNNWYEKNRKDAWDQAKAALAAKSPQPVVDDGLVEKLLEGMPQGWIDDYWRSRKDAVAIVRQHQASTRQPAEARELSEERAVDVLYEAYKSYCYYVTSWSGMVAAYHALRQIATITEKE